MKPPDVNPRQKLLRDWLDKADQDIRSAEALLSQDPPLLYPSCFHSQQAAEKYLKALLTARGIEIPKTHELGRLLRLAEEQDARLVPQLTETVVLNVYAVDIRYPGDQPEPTKSEAREALDLARKVRDAILPILQSLG